MGTPLSTRSIVLEVPGAVVVPLIRSPSAPRELKGVAHEAVAVGLLALKRKALAGIPQAQVLQQSPNAECSSPEVRLVNLIPVRIDSPWPPMRIMRPMLVLFRSSAQSGTKGWTFGKKEGSSASGFESSGSESGEKRIRQSAETGQTGTGGVEGTASLGSSTVYWPQLRSLSSFDPPFKSVLFAWLSDGVRKGWIAWECTLADHSQVVSISVGS